MKQAYTQSARVRTDHSINVYGSRREKQYQRLLPKNEQFTHVLRDVIAKRDPQQTVDTN